MFKKIIAAGAMLALFACSSVDEDKSSTSSQGDISSDSQQGGDGDNSSSSQQGGDGDISSSSAVPSGPSIVQIDIAKIGGNMSMFNTYFYVYALKASAEEDLTPYWNIANADTCKVEKQDTAPPASCQLPLTGAILQHNLTNQYSKLHYKLITTRINVYNGATLKQWNLTGNGDEAALGLNVSENESNNIEDEGITKLNNIVSFEYKYVGGAHEFRVSSKTEGDFWYYEVPATGAITLSPVPDEDSYKTITIPIDSLKPMGSYATKETPFNISKVAKFLWAVKYKAGSSNNTNSLVLYDVKANKIEQ